MSEKNLFIDKNIARVGDQIDQHISKTKNLKNDVPPFSSVEFSINGACNRRCVFCPRVDKSAYPNILNSLNMISFKKLIKDCISIDYEGRFSFAGFCEPLLTKNIDKYVLEIKSNLPKSKVEIVSNGDVLVKKNGSRLLNNLFKAGLDKLQVSLYDGPHQIKEMEKLRYDFKLSEDKFSIRKRYLGSEESHGITMSNRGGSIEYKTDHFELKPLTEPLKQPCYFPFYKVNIDHDGSVLMCSHDWKKDIIYGNINKDSLLTIWSNTKFNKTRKKLSCGDRNYKPCNVCDVDGRLNGFKSFKRWNNYLENKND